MIYPMMLDIKNRCCLVVGGGAVAVRKIKELIKCGAKVRIISPTLVSGLEGRLSDGNIEWVKDFYKDEYLDGALLCFACTDDSRLNRKIAEDAEKKGVLVNMAESGAEEDNCGIRFVVPAVRRKSGLTLAVSCNENPAASRYMADFLESRMEAWLIEYINAVREVRKACRTRIKDAKARQAFMKGLFEAEMLALARESLGKAMQEAEDRLERLYRERSNQDD